MTRVSPLLPGVDVTGPESYWSLIATSSLRLFERRIDSGTSISLPVPEIPVFWYLWEVYSSRQKGGRLRDGGVRTVTFGTKTFEEGIERSSEVEPCQRLCNTLNRPLTGSCEQR